MNEIKVYDPKSLAKTLSPKKELFEKHLGKDTFEKEIAFAAQVIGASAKLQGCTPESILRAVYNLALTGLTLNPVLKLAYLTPRWNGRTKQNECVLVPSYVGLQKLGTEAGGYRKLESILVYDGDLFEVEFAPKNSIKHVKKFRSRDIIACYARCVLQSGETQFEVMDKGELDEIRSYSESWKAYEKMSDADKAKSSTIWKEHEGEMCRKTVIKRLLKYLPKTKEDIAIRYGEAEKLDNVDYGASDDQLSFIETLMINATMDDGKRNSIEGMLDSGMTTAQASEIISFLKENQMNPVTQLGNITSMKQINKELDRKV